MVSTEATSCPQCGVPNPTKPATPATVSGHAVHGEEVVYKAHVHSVIYFWPFVVTLVFILTLAIQGNPAWLRWFFGGLSAMTWLAAYVVAHSMEFVVTNKRVTTRIGILQKNSQETLLEKVETVGVHQDLLGRILGYGTVTVVGTGGSNDVFRRISEPMVLRRMLHDQIDQRKTPATRG
jgi:uncharacterized membrane protein YdbT with pleckstrin-like domain